MILKKLKRRVFTKPKATMIRELIAYILQPKDENGDEKLAYHGAKNFITGTQKGQQAEMIHLAAESVRSRMPVTHWCLSWKESEQPSHEQIDEAVDIFLQRMGLVGHQVLYAQHKNTGHCHVHIVVNRTHPDTLKVVQPHRGFDIEEAHRIVAELVHKQGWAAEGKARYRVNENGKIVRNVVGLFTTSVRTSSAAADFESATGEKSAERIAQEQGHRAINRADSWAELHQNMQKVGLRFEKKGSGAVVFVGDVAVKASSIDRHFGLSKLCKRLGEYEPGDYAPDMKPPEPEPVSTIAQDKWREYRQARADEAERRKNSRKRIISNMRHIREQQREQRRKKLAAIAPHGLSILNIARHYLKKQQQEERERQREQTPAPVQSPVGTFRTWLHQKKYVLQANLWKFRRRITPGLNVRKFEFPKLDDLSAPYTAYREMVKKRFPEKLDESRLDALIALYMRCAGYKDHEIGAGILQEAKPLRQEREHRDWRDYAQRIVNYAFMTPGNIEIAAFNPTPEVIQKFHKEARDIEEERLGKPQQAEAPQYRMRM
jgi:hypothetical protein